MTPQALRTVKRHIRTALTYSKNVAKGYSFSYARAQAADATAIYPYQWSQFTTPIPQRSNSDILTQNRLWNLQLAAQKVHGLILRPGHIFSFWHCVPRPTLKNGFREGPAFIQGQVASDVGGGLCLISTNLFNTFLLAGCQILERHSHSIDPYGERRFFPQGQDATVYYGYKDLIIKNNSPVSLQLRLNVVDQEGHVQSSLWGIQNCPVQVRVESKVLEILPAPKPNGMPGYRVETARWVCDASAMNLLSWQRDYSTVSLYQPCPHAYYASNGTHGS